MVTREHIVNFGMVILLILLPDKLGDLRIVANEASLRDMKRLQHEALLRNMKRHFVTF